ncbi:MAG: efflux RND transporter periplasmic adaptor subunit [Lachnospiraceae bacterium]|nr:efflux RND transporter periplasmic adaptor subunit [Lachnospiraceae bacterium]
MQRKKIFYILGAAAVCAALVGTTAFANIGGIKVQTAVVESGSITQTIEAEGHVESEEVKTYYAKVSAPIAFFDVEAGDLVQKGELIITYDTQDLDRNVEQARLQAEALEAGYHGNAAQASELQNAYNEAAALDESYRQAYEAALTNVNDLQYNIEVVADAVEDKKKALDIKIAELQVKIAAKNAAAADDSYEPEERNDFQVEAAQLQIELARLQKEELELQDVGAEPIQNRYFEEAQMYLSELSVQRSSLQQEMLSTKHAAMNASQLKQLAQNAQLADTTLTWNEQEAEKAKEGVTTEFSGVISDILVAEGAYVSEGSPLFTIKDIENVKAVVEVTSYEMADVELGQKASVKIGADTYEGEVSKIRMETVTDAQNNAKLQVEIHINNPDGKIYLGTDTDAVIETGTSKDAILIPNTALYADDQGDYCYLIENGVIAKRYLVCGLESGSCTEVAEGLQAGEQVITDAMTDDNIGKKVSVK